MSTFKINEATMVSVEDIRQVYLNEGVEATSKQIQTLKEKGIKLIVCEGDNLVDINFASTLFECWGDGAKVEQYLNN